MTEYAAEQDIRRGEGKDPLPYCAAPPHALPDLPSSMVVERQRAIIVGRTKWVNGTTLRYAFIDGGAGPADQMAVVRKSFQEWKDLGLGLNFTEVPQPAEAEVRVG